MLNYIDYGQGKPGISEQNFPKPDHRTFEILEPRDTMVTQAILRKLWPTITNTVAWQKNQSYSAHFSTLSGMLELTIARSNTASYSNTYWQDQKTSGIFLHFVTIACTFNIHIVRWLENQYLYYRDLSLSSRPVY